MAGALGVGLGQGWCFAKPSAELIYPPSSMALPVRRQGEVTNWA